VLCDDLEAARVGVSGGGGEATKKTRDRLYSVEALGFRAAVSMTCGTMLKGSGLTGISWTLCGP